MNPGNSEPCQGADESSLQSSRGANKRRRHDHNEEADELDGQKYPHEAPLCFECPFCKHDPHRYAKCRGHQLNRFSDVTQHIKRQHLLVEVRLGFETDIPERVILYCARCRCLFRGIGAADRLRVHSAAEPQCQITNIERSGVMLDGEVKALRTEVGSCKAENEREKWFIIWKRLFPGLQPPLSPYVEISVPRPQVESIIHDELKSIQGSPPEQVQPIVRRCVDRIYKPSPLPQSSPSVPPQPQSNILQTTSVPANDAINYRHSDIELESRTLQTQTQGFDYSSGTPHLGVDATPAAGQTENSLDWDNTLECTESSSELWCTFKFWE